MSDLAPSFNATRITERLIVGGGIAGPEEVAWLAGQGVTHLISAAAELDDLTLARAAGLASYHIPWQDDGRPKATADFVAALAFVATADAGLAPIGRQAGLYVHCAAGCNRGPLLATYLLAALSGLPAENAWAIIKSQRPVVSAFDVPAYRQSALDALEALRPFSAAGDLSARAATESESSSDGDITSAAEEAGVAAASASRKARS